MNEDFDTNDSMNPGLDDLLQQDQDRELHAPVKVIGAVRNHPLPARNAFSRNVLVSNAEGQLECIPEDLRRQYITIWCTAQSVFVGHDKQSVLNESAGILDTGRELTLHTSAEIWIRGTVAAVSTVSYWTGQWAD